MDPRNLPINQTKNVVFPLFKLAIPLMLTGTIKISIFFFQTLFLAHLGQQILAAGALVSFLFSTVAMMLFGTLASISILISHKHGANDELSISLVVRDGLLLALLLSIPAFVLFWNASHIFLLFGQKPSVVLLASNYLHALAWGLLPNLIMVVLFEIIIGLRHVRIIMIFNFLFAFLNIFFSYILIFGKFWLPAFGIAGAGWGMTISYWIMLIVLLTYVLINKNYKKYFRNIFSNTKPSYLGELFQIGIPMGAMYSIEVAFFLALTLLMGSISSQLLAANQIVLQYAGLIVPMAAYISQAITVQMGFFLGAKKVHLARQINYAGILMAVSIMGLVAIGYWFFPKILISFDFDINNPGNLIITLIIQKLLAICALFQIIEAIRICLFGALRALRDTKFTLLTSILSYWCVALPIGYLLAIKLQLGGIGFWWSLVIGAIFGVILLSLRFESKIKFYEISIKNNI